MIRELWDLTHLCAEVLSWNISCNGPGGARCHGMILVVEDWFIFTAQTTWDGAFWKWRLCGLNLHSGLKGKKQKQNMCEQMSLMSSFLLIEWRIISQVNLCGAPRPLVSVMYVCPKLFFYLPHLGKKSTENGSRSPWQNRNNNWLLLPLVSRQVSLKPEVSSFSSNSFVLITCI